MVQKKRRVCECGQGRPTLTRKGSAPGAARWCVNCPTKPADAVGAATPGGEAHRGVQRRCECGSRKPSFGLSVGDRYARWCALCPTKPADAIRVVKHCKCGLSVPSLGLPGDKEGTWCAKCPDKPENFIKVTGKICECGLRQPSLGLPGESRKDARWCKLCPTKHPKAVNVVSKRCECGKRQPSLGMPDDAQRRPRWCAKCPNKPPGAVNMYSYLSTLPRRAALEAAQILNAMQQSDTRLEMDPEQPLGDVETEAAEATPEAADADTAEGGAWSIRSKRRTPRKSGPRRGRPPTGATSGSGSPPVEPPSWADGGHGFAADVKEEEGLLNLGPQGERDQPGDDYGYPGFAVDDDGDYRLISDPHIPTVAGGRKRQRPADDDDDDEDADDDVDNDAAAADGGGGVDEDEDHGRDGRDDDNDDDADVNSDDGDGPAWEAAEPSPPAAPHRGLMGPPGAASGSGLPRHDEKQRNHPVPAGRHGAQRRFFYDTSSSPSDSSSPAAAAAAGAGSLALSMISGGIADHLRTMDRARAAPPVRDHRLPANGNCIRTPSEEGPAAPRPPLPPRHDGRARASVPSRPRTSRPITSRPNAMSFLRMLSKLSPDFSITPPSPERPSLSDMDLSMGMLDDTRGSETEAARRLRIVSTMPKCFREYYHRVHS